MKLKLTEQERMLITFAQKYCARMTREQRRSEKAQLLQYQNWGIKEWMKFRGAGRIKAQRLVAYFAKQLDMKFCPYCGHRLGRIK